MQGTASALSAGLLGIDGYVVKVTATVELGAPSLTIGGRSGLGAPALAGSVKDRDRVLGLHVPAPAVEREAEAFG